MDLLSHALLGASLGEIILGKKAGVKAMIIGVIAALLPDIDVLGIFFLNDAAQLQFHRGITHSFFFAIIISVLAAWLLTKKYNYLEVNQKQWAILIFSGLTSHFLLDSLTCYGTGLFEPFSSYRVAFDTIFVLDPLYTIPFLVCVVFSRYAKDQIKRAKWNNTGLYISTFYLVFTIINHVYVKQVMIKSFKEQKLSATYFTVTPTPINNFLWMGYSQDKDGAWVGYYSLFDKQKKINYRRILRNDSLLAPFEAEESVQILKELSKGNYIVTKQDSVVYFTDLRFGNLNGWDEADAPFAFRFSLVKNADNKRALSRIRFNSTVNLVLSSLVKRIKGK